MALSAGETGHLADHEETAMYVNHGATAGTARPTLGSAGTAAPFVVWVGSVEPTNALSTDVWVDTTAGSGTYTVIEEQELGSDTATVTFSGIPGTYRNLRLAVRARSDRGTGTADQIRVSFNSDTTAANYNRQRLLVFGTTVAAQESLGAGDTSRDIGDLPQSTSAANHFSQQEIVIGNYADTSMFKTAVNNGLRTIGATTGDLVLQMFGLLWEDTSAITQIDLTCQGNFVAGSVFTLIGEHVV